MNRSRGSRKGQQRLHSSAYIRLHKDNNTKLKYIRLYTLFNTCTYKWHLKTPAKTIIMTLKVHDMNRERLLMSTAVTWLKYCRYGVKLYPINQSYVQTCFFLGTMYLDREEKYV